MRTLTHRAAAALTVALGLGIAGPVMSAGADTLPTPGPVVASFDGWHLQKDRVTISWTAVPNAGLYYIDSSPASIPEAQVSGTATTWSTDAVLPPGPNTFTVTANTPDGDTRSSAVVDVPAPQVTATTVNAAPNELQVAASPAVAGDALTARIWSIADPSNKTDVPLAADGTATLTDLSANTLYVVGVVETGTDSADSVSPEVTTTARTVPSAEHEVTVETRQYDGHPISAFVMWPLPADCKVNQPYCDQAFVVVKPGSTASTDPNDGSPAQYVSADSGPVNMDTVNGLAYGTTYTVTVFRSSDGKHWGPGASATFTDTLYADITETASPAAAEALGEVVTLQASVTSQYATPTGTVTFETGVPNGLHELCPPQPLPSSGVVVCQTTTTDIAAALPELVGTRLILVDYSGDATFEAARLPQITYDVTKALPTVDTAVPATASIHKMVSIRAHVYGRAGLPTGTVKVTRGSVVLCSAAKLSSGRAGCTVSGSKLGAGRRSVTVTYRGDGRYKSAHRQVSFVVKR